MVFLTGALGTAIALGLLLGHPGTGSSTETSGVASLEPTRDGTPGPPPAPGSTALQRLSRPALRFEPNVGQTDPVVRFLARAEGYLAFLTATEVVLVLSQGPPPAADPVTLQEPMAAMALPWRRVPVPGLAPAPSGPSRTVVRMKLLGANPAPAAVGLGELPGKVHYYRGSDPARWRTDIPTYRQVRLRDVYPGIDVVYYGGDRRLAYDFVVAPAADPGAIRLAFEGVDGLDVDGQGNLVLRTAAGELSVRRPVVYQERDGERLPVAASFVVLGTQPTAVGVTVAAYDRARPLVVDPDVRLSALIVRGGSADDRALAIAAPGFFGQAPGVFVTGVTASIDFPTASALDPTTNGDLDVFVMRLGGDTPVYSTYLGGSGIDIGTGIAADTTGNAYVTGVTYSTNFPTFHARQFTRLGPGDAFVTKLTPAGTLDYSTYLGGSGTEAGHAIAVDSAGSAYVTGSTDSADFPVASARQPFYGGGSSDAFVSKLTPAGSGLVYSTFLGGSGQDIGLGIAVDRSSRAHVTGSTSSLNFPRVGLGLAYGGGTTDAFVSTLSASGTVLDFSIYLGGGGADTGSAIALDGFGNRYVTGTTSSTNFPTSSAFQPSLRGVSDAFVWTPGFSTYLGGDGADQGLAIDVSTAGDVWVTGITTSSNFPVTVDSSPLLITSEASQSTYGGAQDAFVTKFRAGGSTLGYSTYLGGPRADSGEAIAVFPRPRFFQGAPLAETNHTVYVAGATQRTSGTADAFVATIADTPGALGEPPSLIPSSAAAGGPGFVLQVRGPNVVEGSQVLWNGSARAAAFVEDAQGHYLSAQILASDLALGGALSATVTLQNPLEGPGQALPFRIFSLSESSRLAGGPGFTLTVSGGLFDASTRVFWNGSERAITSRDTFHLQVAIPASDLATPGTVTVAVTNLIGGGSFAGLVFTVVAGTPVLSVTPASADFGSVAVGASTTRTFTVQNTGTGTLAGSASTTPPFSIVSGGAYSLPAGASQVVTVRYAPTAPGSATGSVSFTGSGGTSRPVTGSAAGGACAVSVAPASASFGAGGGMGTVTVTAPVGCGWSATAPSFVTITLGASGTGNGSVSYVVTANAGTASRTATISIAGQSVAITQAGTGGPGCTAGLSPTGQSFGAGGGTGSVSVTVAAGCAWTATPSASFVTITQGASGSGNGTVTYSVAGNGGPSARTATLTIGGQPFTITQAAGDKLSAFVSGFYQSILGRTPADSEVSAWVGLLRQSPTPATASLLSHEFLDGPEYLSRPVTLTSHVTLLYTVFLGRSPDPGGLKGWVDQLQGQFDTILPGFVDSPEFQRLLPDVRDAAAVRPVITRLYQQVLGRTPQPSEVDGWTSGIVEIGVLGMAKGFFDSPEYNATARTLAQHVRILYRTFLGREPASSEVTPWVNALEAFRVDVENGFIASPEFQARFASLFQ